MIANLLIANPLIIGLDSVYKLTFYGIPVWPIVYVDKVNKRGIPLLFLVGRYSRETVLVPALKEIKKRIPTFFEKPRIVMIDHDQVERKAVVELGCRFLLCEFHVCKVLLYK